ncbi:uncharacterized protein LAJ45_05678 [Morchella importuna]|uniref:uncharacterized protein n=1 Tax=Morchella importuna TaxID=1174673 RepID=UPI001E8E14A4|nr:uncharacterized protein LAJ45_05678 [Morchella importuna]KAH8150465.1 hypothetical protein LAJ45_05678 [Morchella importuna]
MGPLNTISALYLFILFARTAVIGGEGSTRQREKNSIGTIGPKTYTRRFSAFQRLCCGIGEAVYHEWWKQPT